MARRRKNQRTSPRIKEVVQEAAKTYKEIEANREKIEAKKNEPEIRKLVEKVVDSVENKKKLDVLAYDTLVKQFPQTKNTINKLISELRIFSIYDGEPHKVNFDYSAYLEQIEALAEIR
jgi:fructose-1,6-bisphosphatase